MHTKNIMHKCERKKKTTNTNMVCIEDLCLKNKMSQSSSWSKKLMTGEMLFKGPLT